MGLRAWEHKRSDVTPTAAALVAAGRLEPPDLLVEIVGRTGAYVTVVVRSGALSDPSAILYVEGHGTFEVVAVEPWPDTGKFLVIRPWP